MKTFLLMLFSLSIFCTAEEFRYQLMATTGLQEQVFDKNGKSTIIVFSSESDQKARYILSQLLSLEGINGTASPEKIQGTSFDQAIILNGQLNPKILKTKSVPNTAASEDYQEFVLEGIKIQFPFSRWEHERNFIHTYFETHFSFETLFPDGVEYNGAAINLADHTAKAPKVKNGQPDQPETKHATIPSFIIEGLNIQEAVRKLNREIWEHHPGEFDLLVGYVVSPWGNRRFNKKPLNLHLINNPPVPVIVQYLTTKSYCQYGFRGPKNTGITIFGWASQDIEQREPKIKAATLPSFSVKDLNLHDAIRKLNREIWKKYNWELGSLVSYVEAPGPTPRDKKPITASFPDNTPVKDIVSALTSKSFCHYQIQDSTIVVYGWHQPQLRQDKTAPKETDKE